MAHKGVKESTNQELGAYALGQNGFAMLINSPAVTTEYEAVDYGVKYFTEIKVVESIASIQLHSYMAGGDNTLRIYHSSVQSENTVQTDDLVRLRNAGVPSTLAFQYNSLVTTPQFLPNGSFISGAFDKITLYNSSYILAYLGPKQ